jgi:hypothetical protein
MCFKTSFKTLESRHALIYPLQKGVAFYCSSKIYLGVITIPRCHDNLTRPFLVPHSN